MLDLKLIWAGCFVATATVFLLQQFYYSLTGKLKKGINVNYDENYTHFQALTSAWFQKKVFFGLIPVFTGKSTLTDLEDDEEITQAFVDLSNLNIDSLYVEMSPEDIKKVIADLEYVGKTLMTMENQQIILHKALMIVRYLREFQANQCPPELTKDDEKLTFYRLMTKSYVETIFNNNSKEGWLFSARIIGDMFWSQFKVLFSILILSYWDLTPKTILFLVFPSLISCLVMILNVNTLLVDRILTCQMIINEIMFTITAWIGGPIVAILAMIDYQRTYVIYQEIKKSADFQSELIFPKNRQSFLGRLFSNKFLRPHYYLDEGDCLIGRFQSSQELFVMSYTGTSWKLRFFNSQDRDLITQVILQKNLEGDVQNVIFLNDTVNIGQETLCPI